MFNKVIPPDLHAFTKKLLSIFGHHHWAENNLIVQNIAITDLTFSCCYALVNR